jgi:DNA-binding FadR family transcriptional regulator
VLDFAYQKGLQEEHLKVMRAISARDPDAARQAMRDHLAASQERYYARLAEQQIDYRPGRGLHRNNE